MEKTRFSLLLLEPGEYYFDDYSVYFINDEKSIYNDEVGNNAIGRLKLCSKSLVFDPRVIARPLIKIPLKDIKCIEIFKNDKFSEIIEVECNLHIEMLAGNVMSPYFFKHNLKKFYIVFNYAKAADCLTHILQLHRAASLPIADQNQMIAAIAYDRQCRTEFDLMWLDLDEKILLEVIGSKVTPLVVNPGKIILTSNNLFFQPFNNIELNHYIKIKISTMTTIIKRRFLLQHVGIEIYCKNDGSTSYLYLLLKSKAARDQLYDTINKIPSLRLDESNQEIMTLQWQNGTISNYDYLLYLNSMADRTFNDLTQYPVFPWVISDYTSEKLDLTNPSTFRDLSKPIGALNPDRLKKLKERYNEMPPPKFLYGSHYSTPGFVLFYLVRKYPNYMLCLQNGRFDHPDRMFNDIGDVWKNVLRNMSDFKELVPEFYDINSKGDFLQNMYAVNFGSKHNGVRVGDVSLPSWAKSTDDFVQKLREALECDYVSAQLHEWIDLIFGYKQSGEEAVKANNKFYYLCYEGAVDLDSIKEWNKRQALEVQIMEFGQIPKQVFSKPHPARTCAMLDIGISLTPSATAKIDFFKSHDFNYYWKWKTFSSEPAFSYYHKQEVTDVVITNDSTIVHSVGQDTLMKMFDIVNFKQERSMTLNRIPLTRILLLEDDVTAIIGCYDSQILIYNIECANILDSINSHEDSITGIAWCKITKRLISASVDGFVRVWQGDIPWKKLKITTGLMAELRHETAVTCVSLSRKEEFLATGTDHGIVYIWNMNTYKVLHKLLGHSSKVMDMKFNYEADRIITCSLDRSFRIFDSTTGLQVYVKTLDEELRCLLWDGCRVMFGGTFGNLYLWHLVKNELIMKICNAHNDMINTIECSQDGSAIVTGGQDGMVAIWSTIT